MEGIGAIFQFCGECWRLGLSQLPKPVYEWSGSSVVVGSRDSPRGHHFLPPWVSRGWHGTATSLVQHRCLLGRWCRGEFSSLGTLTRWRKVPLLVLLLLQLASAMAMLFHLRDQQLLQRPHVLQLLSALQPPILQPVHEVATLFVSVYNGGRVVPPPFFSFVIQGSTTGMSILKGLPYTHPTPLSRGDVLFQPFIFCKTFCQLLLQARNSSLQEVTFLGNSWGCFVVEP